MWSKADDEDAAERFAALLTLEHNRYVEELKAAKIPQHTIDALYPSEFINLVEGLIGYFGVYDLDAFDGRRDDDWQNHAGSTSSLLRDVSADLKALSQKEYDQFIVTPEGEALLQHFASNISGKAVDARARIMVEALFYAHWFMLRAEESGSRTRIGTYFIEITDWLMPDLWDRIMNEIEAGR